MFRISILNLICGLCLFLRLSPEAGCAEVTSPVRVMTFNIRNGEARDRSNSWQFRRELVARTIRQSAPDLLGVQECLTQQREYLLRELPEYAAFGADCAGDGTGEACPVFYRQGDWLLLAGGNFWLTETPDTPAGKAWRDSPPRVATWCRLLQLKSGENVFLFNTHVDYRGRLERRNAAQLIVRRVDELTPPEARVILLGDFNAAPTDFAYEILRIGGFADAWLTAARQQGPPVTISNFQPPLEDDDPHRFDWLLHRGPWFIPFVETVLYHEQDRFPSKHFPVCAEFLFSAGTEHGSAEETAEE